MTPEEARIQTAEVVRLVAEIGYVVDDATVEEFVARGSGPESSVGPDYDEARDAAIEQACDELGIEVAS